MSKYKIVSIWMVLVIAILAIPPVVHAQSQPEIDFSPLEIEFRAVKGHGAVATRVTEAIPDSESSANATRIVESERSSYTLKIWNSGSGILRYTLSDNAVWLSTSRTEGTPGGETNADYVGVFVDAEGLSVGKYSAEITITASRASNSPKTIPVTLEVVEAEATIGYSPYKFDLTVFEGGALPIQKLEVWNDGEGNLEYTLSDDSQWIKITRKTGSSRNRYGRTQSRFSIDTDGLTAGEYKGTITISSENSTNGPVNVAVNLTVTDSVGMGPVFFGVQTKMKEVAGNTTSTFQGLGMSLILGDGGIMSLKTVKVIGSWIGEATYTDKEIAGNLSTFGELQGGEFDGKVNDLTAVGIPGMAFIVDLAIDGDRSYGGVLLWDLTGVLNLMNDVVPGLILQLFPGGLAPPIQAIIDVVLPALAPAMSGISPMMGTMMDMLIPALGSALTGMPNIFVIMPNDLFEEIVAMLL